MKVGLYVRVSTGKQAREGDSLDAQRQRLLAYCQQQPDFLVVDIYADEGISAKDLDHRPDMLRLLEDCKAGKVDLVMFSDLTRASRSVMDTAELTRFFLTHGIQARALNFDIDMTTATGRYVLNLQAATAQHERERTAERVKEVMTNRAKNGRRNGGTPPFGYDLKKGELVVNPTEAQIIREMFDTFLQVNSIRKTAKILNERGYVNKHGAAWKAFTVHHSLRNPAYIGCLRWGRKTTNPLTGKRERAAEKDILLIPDAHDAILDKSVFEQAQAILAQHDKPVRGGAFYLLRGLVRCGRCGAKMQPSRNTGKGKTYLYYICPTMTHNGVNACPQGTVRIDRLDAAIIQELTACSQNREFLIDKQRMLDALKDATKQDRLSERLDALDKQEAAVNGKISRLLGLFERGAVDESDFAPLYQQRKSELAALQQQKDVLQRAHTEAGVVFEEMRASLEAVSTFGDGWDTLTPEQQRERILMIVAAVIVTGTDVNVLLKVDNKALISGEECRFAEVFDMVNQAKHNRKPIFTPIDDLYALNVPFSRRRRSL